MSICILGNDLLFSFIIKYQKNQARLKHIAGISINNKLSS